MVGNIIKSRRFFVTRRGVKKIRLQILKETATTSLDEDGLRQICQDLDAAEQVILQGERAEKAGVSFYYPTHNYEYLYGTYSDREMAVSRCMDKEIWQWKTSCFYDVFFRDRPVLKAEVLVRLPENPAEVIKVLCYRPGSWEHYLCEEMPNLAEAAVTQSIAAKRGRQIAYLKAEAEALARYSYR